MLGRVSRGQLDRLQVWGDESGGEWLGVQIRLVQAIQKEPQTVTSRPSRVSTATLALPLRSSVAAWARLCIGMPHRCARMAEGGITTTVVNGSTGNVSTSLHKGLPPTKRDVIGAQMEALPV